MFFVFFLNQILLSHKGGNQTQNCKEACAKENMASNSRATNTVPGIRPCFATQSISSGRRSPWEEKHQIGTPGSGVQEEARGRNVWWIPVF